MRYLILDIKSHAGFKPLFAWGRNTSTRGRYFCTFPPRSYHSRLILRWMLLRLYMAQRRMFMVGCCPCSQKHNYCSDSWDVSENNNQERARRKNRRHILGGGGYIVAGNVCMFQIVLNRVNVKSLLCRVCYVFVPWNQFLHVFAIKYNAVLVCSSSRTFCTLKCYISAGIYLQSDGSHLIGGRSCLSVWQLVSEKTKH